MDFLLYYIWLNTLKGIGPVLAHELLSFFHTPYNVFTASLSDLVQVHNIGSKTAHYIINSKDLALASKILDVCAQHEIVPLPITHDFYPPILLNYFEAPIVLYTKGNLLPLQSNPCAAIVGARRCDNYGQDATIDLASHLSSQNINVISGMAKGIDSYAHTSALKNNGYTVAVLGTGPDICYPSEHLSLMQQIIKNGAIISAFPPGTPTHKANFIKRNELIAMLSDQLFIMQASTNSGALYTAEYGLKHNKEVYALPGSIYNSLNLGTNMLIAKGAKIYTGHLAPNTCNTNKTSVSQSLISTKVIKLLKDAPMYSYSIGDALNLNTDSLQLLLLELELNSLIVQMGGLVKLTKEGEQYGS
ncbi:MAG: DNA-processing protein DprA [Cellulosilyticaceae bacterium]